MAMVTALVKQLHKSQKELLRVFLGVLAESRVAVTNCTLIIGAINYLTTVTTPLNESL